MLVTAFSAVVTISDVIFGLRSLLLYRLSENKFIIAVLFTEPLRHFPCPVKKKRYFKFPWQLKASVVEKRYTTLM
jgi:hypothetical protein